jgi:hypothetical protein
MNKIIILLLSVFSFLLIADSKIKKPDYEKIALKDPRTLICNQDNIFLICDYNDESSDNFYTQMSKKNYIGIRGGVSYVPSFIYENDILISDTIAIPFEIFLGRTIGDFVRLEFMFASTANEFIFQTSSISKSQTQVQIKARPVEIMGNIIIDVPTIYRKIRHFGGVGLGVSYNNISSYIVNGRQQTLNSDVSINFAWRLFAGISYLISKGSLIEVAYSYSDYGKIEIKTDTQNNTIPLKSHEILFGLRFKF